MLLVGSQYSDLISTARFAVDYNNLDEQRALTEWALKNEFSYMENSRTDTLIMWKSMEKSSASRWLGWLERFILTQQKARSSDEEGWTDL